MLMADLWEQPPKEDQMTDMEGQAAVQGGGVGVPAQLYHSQHQQPGEFCCANRYVIL